jgi:hypothetical protein
MFTIKTTNCPYSGWSNRETTLPHAMMSVM